MSKKYGELSDDELKELAKQKNKATSLFKRTAIAAQRELWNRHHWGVTDSCVEDGVSDRDLVDVQYNG